jgi:hypothetical protein
MRSEELIQQEKQSAKDLAEQLDEEENRPIDALAAMIVYRTLKWVDGEGAETLDEELLDIDFEDDGD